MGMVVTDLALAQMLQQYLLPFFRIVSLFMVMPILGTRIVSARTRIILAFWITLISAPLLPPMPVMPLLGLQTWVAILQEVLIGVLVGFVFLVVFQVFVLAGQFIALKLGMGFSAMNDPASGVSVTSLSQFYLLMVTLMFVAVNGHILLIELVVQSYAAWPPGVWLLSSVKFAKVAALGSWLFAGALLMSLPVFAFLMIVNIAFGVMSRSAPQLNIFAVGFPFTLVCGLVMIWLGLSNFDADFERINAEGFMVLHQLLETR
jgi:flagellar biosynthesis protein FliR